MSYNYAPISQTAKRIIDKFGRTVIKRTQTTSGLAYDPTVTNVDTNIVGAFTSFSNSEIDGTLILARDKKVLTYTEVTVADKIVDDSIVYSVVNVEVVQIGTRKIIYKVQVRI